MSAQKTVLTLEEAVGFLNNEARLLDERRFDEWLDLYCEDAVFWVPAWRDENAPTESPDTELSLVYYAGRQNLVDRVWRLRSGLSVASTPLSRTVHSVAGVMLDEAGQDAAIVASVCTVHLFNPRRKSQHVFFGRYQHRLKQVDGAWKIAAKKIVLVNDYIPTVVDFYCL